MSMGLLAVRLDFMVLIYVGGVVVIDQVVAVLLEQVFYINYISLLIY